MQTSETTSLKKDFRQILNIAIPVVITQVGMMAMGVVDTLVIGRVGPAELAGVGAGNAIFYVFAVAASGILQCLDPFVSQAFGAQHRQRLELYFWQGLWLAATLSLVFTPIVWLCAEYYFLVGAASEIEASTVPYLKFCALSLPFHFAFITLQRFWQGCGVARPFTLIVIAANVVNYFGDMAFVTGSYGFPKLDAVGVAIATSASRFFMISSAIIYTISHQKRFGFDLFAHASQKIKIAFTVQKEFLTIGIPAGLQITAEVVAFTIATTMSTRLGSIASATHHIALTMISTSFMIPLGLSSAAAVRVGALFGEGHWHSAVRSGWLAITLSVVIMSITGICMYTMPDKLFGLFTTDTQVIEMGLQILIWAALFQIFDGIQVSTTGALRGLGQTKLPMLANFIGHYPIGLTSGLILCFQFDYNLVGLWIGLTLGLTSVALMNLGTWWRYSHNPSSNVLLENT